MGGDFGLETLSALVGCKAGVKARKLKTSCCHENNGFKMSGKCTDQISDRMEGREVTHPSWKLCFICTKVHWSDEPLLRYCCCCFSCFCCCSYCCCYYDDDDDHDDYQHDHRDFHCPEHYDYDSDHDHDHDDDKDYFLLSTELNLAT